MFTYLTLKNWRQFSDVQVDFHPQLTILTGANGAGKTTLLNLLNRHFGWNMQFLGVPGRRKEGGFEYDSGYWERRATLLDPAASYDLIGEVGYRSGFRAQLALPRSVGETFQPEIMSMQAVNGLFIPSHRPNHMYQRVTSIPTDLASRESLFDAYASEVRSRYTSGASGVSPSFRIKEALISLATFGFGSEVVERNTDAVETFQGFERILRVVLPPSLGFRRLEVRVPEIVLETQSGTFPFDAVSGGVAAVIDLAWQMYTFSLRGGEFVAIIDEPENHLHPELQQRLLPTFIEAFPEVQFIAATHNPFIVSAVRDSSVYALRYREDGRVYSSRLKLADKAGTADEVLREVLGVPVTLPLWAFRELEAMIARFADGDLSDATNESLRNELEHMGLGELFPRTLADVLRRRADDSAD